MQKGKGLGRGQAGACWILGHGNLKNRQGLGGWGLAADESFLTSTRSSATICSDTMFNARKTRKALSELEHLVMAVLWDRRSATAEDVRTALAARHPMKESTVRTVL